MENAIEVYNLNKKIKNKFILNNINFKIKKNIVFGIVGPNGSGKTTLLRILMDLYKPSSGFFKFNQIIYSGNKEIYKSISSLIESPKFYDNFSGKENLELYNILYNNKIDINNLIDSMNLNEFINKKVKTYSLGMRQKLALALNILNKPEILILDEPTNGFDPGEVIKFKELIKSLRNVTVIICTHDLSLIYSLCNEVLFIKNGRIIENKNAPFENIEVLEKLFVEVKWVVL